MEGHRLHARPREGKGIREHFWHYGDHGEGAGPGGLNSRRSFLSLLPRKDYSVHILHVIRVFHRMRGTLRGHSEGVFGGLQPTMAGASPPPAGTVLFRSPRSTYANY